MEKSNTAVEESSHTSDINTPVTKSLGSLIQIESISIDLDIPMPKKEEGNCQHFSIRGYVAEMRKRDWKSCSPFASTSDCNVSEEQLPPLDVPKYRWWRCKNCINEIGRENAGDEIEILSPSCRSRLISVNMASTSTSTANILSEKKHESIASRNVDRDKAIMDDSPNTSGYDFISKHNKGRFSTSVEDKSVPNGKRTGLGSVRNEEIRYPTIEVAISKHCSSQEIATKSPAVNLSNNSIRVASSDSTLSGGKIFSHGNLQVSADDVSSDIGLEKAMLSPDKGLMTASTTFKKSDEHCSSDKAPETSKPKLRRLPSLELREYNETSSGSETVLAENRQCDLHNDLPNGLPRRRTRKVRLLTDILGGVVSSGTSHAKAERNALSTTPAVSSEVEPVAVPRDKGSFQKKRRILQEDDCNMSEMGIQRKRVRSSNGGAERSSIAIEIVDSRSEGKESDGEGIPMVTKSLRSKHRNGISKKKKKQLRPGDGYSPGISWEDTTMENSGSKGYGAVNGLVHSSHCASTARKPEPHLRTSYHSLLGTDRDSGLCWKSSSKFPEVGHVPSTLMRPDNNFHGESSTGRINPVPVTNGMGMMTFQPEHDLSAQVRLDLSLNIFRDSDKHAENDITQSKNMTNWPFVLQKCNKSSDPRRKDNTLCRESNVSGSGQSSRKGVIYDLNQGIPQTSSMWQDIQNSPILLQKENHHIPTIMERPRQHNEATLNGFLDHSEALKHHRNQHCKPLEQGLSDDIPMEIVELMAKNQYERSLTENKTKCIIERNNGIARPYPELHESGAMTWSRPGVSSFDPANVNMKANVGANRGSSLQISHIKKNRPGMDQVERPQVKLFGTFPQTQQVSSSKGQSSTSMHIRSGLQHGEEANPVWFPTVQNIPFGVEIPQKGIAQPNDKMIHGQAPASLQKGKTISDIKCGDGRMQNDPCLVLPKSGNADLNMKGMGSVDSYSNETIPAMQLLSLMDRGRPSNPPFNLEANKLLDKPFTPCSYHPRFQMDGKQSILNGSYLSHHQLKESSGIHSRGYCADQISFKSRGHEKPRKTCAPARFGGSKSEKFVSSGGLLSMARGSRPEKDKQYGILGTSSSQVLPLQDHNASTFFRLEGHNIARAVLPAKSNSEINICSLNRNPAEFSVPEEGNPFTWSVEDARMGKKISSSRERSHTVDLNKRKRGRMAKEGAARPPPLGRAL